MQLRERIILNSEMADVRAIFNSTVETSLLELLGVSRVLRNEKVNAISTLASRQELLAVLTPLSPQAKMLLVPIGFFFSIILWRVQCFDKANVILAICFTLRGHDTLIDFLWFLNFWSAWFALWCKSIFFDLFRSVKLFLVAQQVRLLGPLFLSKVPQDLNN